MSVFPQAAGATRAPLPYPLPQLVQAAGAVAAAAVERGNLAAARRAFERASAAPETVAGRVTLRLVSRPG